MKRALPFIRRSMKILGSKRSTLDVAHKRLVIMSIAFSLGYILIAARIVDLSLIQGQLAGFSLQNQAEPSEADVAFDTDGKRRGDITDRNGTLLATSLQTASLYADPAIIPDAEQVARQLAKTLPGASYGDLLAKLQRKTRFIWLHRNLTPNEQFAVLKLGHPGLNFRTEYRRIYPQGPLAAHMVGFTNVDGHGLAGVERYFDARLSKGEPLQLSLDMRLQHILRRETGRALREYTGKTAAGAIVDVKTGEVLAAVSLPDFDPHNPPGPGDKRAFNMLTQGVYELGSTFKIFSTAAALDIRHLGLDYALDARQPLKRFGRTIHDYHAENRFLSVPEVFMHSSNIGSALMGEMVGTEGMKHFFADLGFTKPLPFESREINPPLIPNPWRDIHTLTASYGHGVAISPMQMVAAATSIVGGGVMIHPTLMLTDPKELAEKPVVRVVSPETSLKMRELMRLVVTSGTAKFADVPGYSVGGKTGTADKSVNGGYDRTKKLTNFMGFFPMEDPKYAVFVMVDEPNPSAHSYGYATAGWVAAPAVGRIIAAVGPLLGMQPVERAKDQELSSALTQYVRMDKPGGGNAPH